MAGNFVYESLFMKASAESELVEGAGGGAPVLPLDELIRRMRGVKEIPSVPAILMPLLHYLELPIGEISVQKIVDLISCDKSVTAQCLHMANSPLFGRWNDIESVHDAVVALGVVRVRDIAMSCCILKIMPKDLGCIDPRIFWEHSLGVALVNRKLAKRVGYRDPEKAYLAGLLHDVGIIVNHVILPEQFRETTSYAYANRVAFQEAELKTLGTSHCVTGMLLAEDWHLGSELSEVIRRHHDFDHASLYRAITALTHLSDLICRYSGLGYGFNEAEKMDLAASPAWSVLMQECPAARHFGAAQFTSEMDQYVNEVRRLVGVLFRIDSLQ